MKLITLLLLFACTSGLAQNATLKDSSIVLDVNGAYNLSLLPLKCIHKEFPNKTSHISNSQVDHVLLPSELHPAFYGCFDWHSSVHGHWMLIRLLKIYPNLPNNNIIRHALDKNLTARNIQAETNYFNFENTRGWERTYGWAWLLKMNEELLTWNDPDAKRWHQNLQPLTNKIISLWMDFIPKQTYPHRNGVHTNTAFGLVFALDYARAKGDTLFEKQITDHAIRLFRNDTNAPAIWEPNGADFLSPSLEEADLMIRVLSKDEFTNWRDNFFTDQALKHLTTMPVVSDRSDLQIVHLDGLYFSRSWCMKRLAESYPVNDPRRKMLFDSYKQHLSIALKAFSAGHYSGDHWLASFAVYALTN